MRAIAIREPAASQIADGKKTREHRSRRIALGPLLVVAHGRAVCLVDVVRVSEHGDGFRWHLANPRRVRPIDVRSFGWIVHVADERIQLTSPPQKATRREHASSPLRRAGPCTYRVGGETTRRSWKDAHARAVELARTHGTRISVYKPDPFGGGEAIAFTLGPLA